MKRFYTRRLLLALVLSQGALASCAMVDRDSGLAEVPETDEAPPEPLGEVSFRVLHKADYNIDDRPTYRNFLVLTDAVSYASELKNYSIEFPAEIDFAADSIVVATMGTQASGGYAIGATSAEEYEDKVVMRFELVTPADGCLTTQAQSNPYEFVLVQTNKPIEFIEVPRVELCE